ncbi:hypothetical protein RQP46_004463 [Phenoliferia psychrophenolica]
MSYEPLPSSPSAVGGGPSFAQRRASWRPRRPIVLGVSLLTLAALLGLASSDVHQRQIKDKVGSLVTGGVELAGSAKEWWSGPWAPSVYDEAKEALGGALGQEEDRLAESWAPEESSAGSAGGAANDGGAGRTPAAPTSDDDLSNTLESGAPEPEPEAHTLTTTTEPGESDSNEAATDTADDELPTDDLEPMLDPGVSESDLDSTECTDELKASLSLPSFWVARKTSSLHYEITPREPLIVPAGDCFDNTVFSARLVSVSRTADADLIISALPAPSLTDILGVYDLVIPPTHVIPYGQYQVEIRLAFGSLAGAREGSVCGEGRETCIAANLPSEQKFIGEKIGMAPGSRVTLGQDATSLAKAKLCSSLSPLTGYWQGQKFFPADPAGGPCMLQAPVFPTPFAAASTEPIWIHIVGDSNPRNFDSALEKSFGGGSKLNFFTMASPVKNGTVAAIALRSSTGTYDAHANDADPNIVITWQWWHATSHNLAANAAELAWWTNGTLAEFMSRAQLKGVLKGHRGFQHAAATLRPTRTYISLGSHSEDLTAAGTSKLLDVLFSEDYVSQEQRETANVRLFTTTTVSAALIPVDRFPRQDLVRNNAVIHAKNDVLRSRPELAGRIIDAEGLTAGITENYMKKTGKPDAVHFLPTVYEMWARLVWTDLMLQ